MRKKKKLLTILLAVCLVAAMMPSMVFAANAKSDDIVVLYTNDVHCGIDDSIGYAGLAAYKADKLKETKNVVLVDAGDAIQGDLAGALSKGDYIVDIMNQVGYDVAIPGNHEFDFGMDQFLALTKKSNAKYISSNFTDTKANKTVFDPYVIKELGGKKVAFVGISTPESITKSTPAFFQDEKGNYIYDFCNDKTGKKLYKAVQNAIDAAKAEGADYVIALGHMGIDDQSKPWTSREVIANTTGLNAFIDGHSHSTVASEAVKDKDGKEVTLSQTGTKLAAIGELIITADGKISTSLVTDYAAKDEKTASLIKEVKDKIEAVSSKKVGTSEVLLTTLDAEGKRAVRNQETTMGNFCADAYRIIGGADIGIVQGGGVRADIKAGDVTYGDIIALHPWGNMYGVIEATGQQILDALELGARSTPDEVGGFLQVSGISYEIDTTVPSTVVTDENAMFVKVAGARRVVNVKVGGVPIDPKKTYTVASTTYILTQQGDGFTMFDGCKEVTKESLVDTEVIQKYIEKLGGTIGQQYAKTEGRIKVLTASDKAPIKEYKAALARTTKITSAKASTKTKKITVKINGNIKAYGFYYKVTNSKGKTVSSLSKPGKTFTTKKLSKGKYTVSVRPYTYVIGEKVYGKTVSKKVTIK
ncbi:bifunctional metallophosphatase/5'-nucleotidase [Emergencia timonensis]|uniref:bifunctional metallophosphatase/5'-nucleotidase n=1 Tax=Emergencia timonensis TaxID=1776384 RepID=UPI0039965FBA